MISLTVDPALLEPLARLLLARTDMPLAERRLTLPELTHIDKLLAETAWDMAAAEFKAAQPKCWCCGKPRSNERCASRCELVREDINGGQRPRCITHDSYGEAVSWSSS